MSGNGNYFVDGYFEEKREELVRYINQLNADAQRDMDENEGLYIGLLTNDPDHWADYGVYDPYTLEKYLDNEAKQSQEMI